MSDKKPVLFSPGVGKRGMTQLHYDAYCGNLPGLVWCLERRMSPNKKDTYRGYTAVHWLTDMAAVDGPRVEMLKALVQYGADVNLEAKDGTTALMLARAAGSKLGKKLATALVCVGAKDEKPA